METETGERDWGRRLEDGGGGEDGRTENGDRDWGAGLGTETGDRD